MNNPLRTEVFVSYSHRDDVWREELLYTLSPYLQRERTNISVWADRDIKTGDKWDDEIRQAIGRARVAVLLVSKYFLASNYIKEKELPLIFSMLQDGLRIVWVPVSACMYTETELNSYQAVFDPSIPLDARNTSEQQRALVKVCQAIREAFQNRPSDEPIKVQPFKPAQFPTPATAADESLAQGLLFCVMAIQNEWIDPVQMSKACSEWATDKSKSLPEILIQRQWISSEDKLALDAMLRRSLSRHAGDAEKALVHSGGGFALQVVKQSQIPALQRSLDRLSKIAAAEEQPDQWTVGSSDRYEWQALHAAGSFSEVYCGLDRSFDRPVALKTVHSHLSATEAPHHQRRLIAEAKIAGQLEHPHIVPVYDLAKRAVDEEPFYAMRMLRGPTLADEIRRHHEGKIQGRCDTLERRRLIESLLCVCHAMEYAHARGVMHLDLKPQNVALGDYREVYLLDWGLSRPVACPSSGSLSKISMNDTLSTAFDETQGAIGTPAYMSPEQAAGDLARFDQRTDVYGLGAILFEILTGHPPHNAEDTENCFANIREQPVLSAREIATDVPAMLAEICDKAIALQMEDRHASVEDLSIDLRRYLDDEPLLSYRANVEQFEKLLAESPHRHDFREGIARNLFNLGLIQNGMLRHAAAENSLNKALEHYKQLVHKFPRDPRLRSELAVGWLHLYYVLTAARKFEQAEIAKRNALEEYHRLPTQDGYLMSIISRLDGAAVPESLTRAIAAPAAEKNVGTVPRGSEWESLPPVDKTIFPTESVDMAPGETDFPNHTNFATLAPAVLDDNLQFGEAITGPRYRILRLFASGGLSRLYVAYDEALQREVALKELREQFANSISSRNQFLNEARITAVLDHPGIVPIYSLGTYPDDRPFYAMKLVKGRTLSEAIREWHSQANNTYSPLETKFRSLLMHMVATCNTLAFAHSNAIAHCDIKPLNILIGSYGETYVIDWGLARTFLPTNSSPSKVVDSGAAPSDYLADGQLFGTPVYMSPEQASGKTSQLNARSDIYSLGATLFELLVGIPPGLDKSVSQSDVHDSMHNIDDALREEANTVQVGSPSNETHNQTISNLIKARAMGEFVAPRSLNPAIPKTLEAICMKAMALDPSDRYASALELAADIERWFSGS